MLIIIVEVSLDGKKLYIVMLFTNLQRIYLFVIIIVITVIIVIYSQRKSLFDQWPAGKSLK